MSNNDGTIDITDTVEYIKSTFVNLGSTYLYGLLCSIPYGGSFFSLPVVSTLTKRAIAWGMGALANWSVLQLFFTNTAIRKASQARDYIDAVIFKINLPENVSDAEYKKAEQNEMLAFKNFIMVTN